MAGTLSATIGAVAPQAAAVGYTGSGLLDVATMTPIMAMPIALAGAGTLTAPVAASYNRAAVLAGAGTLSATDTQKYAPAPSFTGAGTLSATAVGQIPFQVIGTPQVVSATSITLPTHAIGDIIILIAVRASTTLPGKPTASGTVPAWVDIDTATGNDGIRTVYFKATATNHTSGTWTSATGLCCIVLRGQKATSPIGGHAVAEASTLNTVNAPAVTMTKTDGTSFLLHFYWHPNASAWSAVPAGYTRRASEVFNLCLNSKNVTTSDGAISQPCTTSVAAFNRSATIEILNVFS